MQTLNKFLVLFLFTFCWAIPLSIGQQNHSTSAESVTLVNASFEQTDGLGRLLAWQNCKFEDETPPDIQPGLFGCKLAAQKGELYMGMVGRDNGSFEAIYSNLLKPLKAGICYRMSVYLAKSLVYESNSRLTGLPASYIRPLKLSIWGLSGQMETKCPIKPDDWLAESLPIHSDSWRKYTFYIQPPKDVDCLVFSANHVVEKVYNGNLLLDNISVIEPVNCTDFRLISGGQKGAFLVMQEVSDVISMQAPQLFFGKKKAELTLDSHTLAIEKETRHKSFDTLLAYFEQSDKYKLIMRVKGGKKLSKQRVAFLYSYIFKNTNLKAQRVEIKPYSPKDEAYFWTFENEEIAISFDSVSSPE